ncbi:unnamed protein product [Macrosiphum euphorbiae]|uniref:Uncharacterized protein n=1 Tax=Macrosiphum euphorbiae TaxID=13131 RepID=A0AAV0W9Z4_9HEMI|nr:unnamed protein product [Macrosiphum euphorbiae]
MPKGTRSNGRHVGLDDYRPPEVGIVGRSSDSYHLKFESDQSSDSVISVVSVMYRKSFLSLGQSLFFSINRFYEDLIHVRFII